MNQAIHTIAKILCLSSGINRVRYILSLIGIFFVTVLVAMALDFFGVGDEAVKIIMISVIFPPFVVITIRRLVDIRASKWFAVLIVVPFISIALSLLLALVPGKNMDATSPGTQA